jgi:hypothetical protein
MAEISPPTTRPLPSDPAFVRTAGIDDKGTTRIVVIGASSGGGGDATVFRQNPEVTRSSP